MSRWKPSQALVKALTAAVCADAVTGAVAGWAARVGGLAWVGAAVVAGLLLPAATIDLVHALRGQAGVIHAPKVRQPEVVGVVSPALARAALAAGMRGHDPMLPVMREAARTGLAVTFARRGNKVEIMERVD